MEFLKQKIEITTSCVKIYLSKKINKGGVISMETIIQQICMNIVEKVLKTLKESKNLSLDIITPEIREESNNTCLSIVEEYIKIDTL